MLLRNIVLLALAGLLGIAMAVPIPELRARACDPGPGPGTVELLDVAKRNETSKPGLKLDDLDES